MLFSSPVFLFAFLPVVLAVYYGPLRGMRRGQNLFLLAASLFFYGWKEPVFVLVMVGSIGVNYLLGLWAGRCRRRGQSTRGPVWTAVALNLSLLFAFKYLSFVLANLRGAGLAVPVVEIALPVGISFFTFQALSYVIDVARGDGEVQKNPLHVGLYIAFFPQLIAGPIVKYRTVAQQIEGRRESWPLFSQGCYRFLLGLGKKVILSNQLAVIADAAFDAPPDSMAMAWLGLLCYTFQIYFDFGGYSDMAIGLGKMFGFRFLENFRYPYLADSCRDFWKRWHISLITWFRDYLYIPLGGSHTKTRWGTTRNMLLVWLFTGAWHGANWTYLVWGLGWFGILTLERLLDPLGPSPNGRWALPVLPRWARRVVTFFIVNLTMAVFRAESLPKALVFFRALFCMDGIALGSAQAAYYLEQNSFLLFLSALAIAPTATWLRGRLARLAQQKQLPRLLPVWDALCAVTTAAIFLISASFLVKGVYNPFIYFNF